jgi:hypothetical protein
MTIPESPKSMKAGHIHPEKQYSNTAEQILSNIRIQRFFMRNSLHLIAPKTATTCKIPQSTVPDHMPTPVVPLTVLIRIYQIR